MSETSLLDLFRSRWQEIARQFWPQTPREQLQAELARLNAELGRRHDRLLILRKRIEKQHYYLKRRERNLARLATVVQKLPAETDMRPKLECLQRGVDRLRERLRERERGYARRLARLRKRKQEWADLRERFLSGSLPQPIADESDPDYPF